MSQYHVRVFHNDTPRSQRDVMDRYEENHHVQEVAQFSYTVGRNDETHEKICNNTFEALNVESESSPYRAVTDRYREARKRSLSVGDLVSVDLEGVIRTFAVAPFGWKEVPFPTDAELLT